MPLENCYGHALAQDDPLLVALDLPRAGTRTRFVLRRTAGFRLQLQDREQPQMAPLGLDWDGPEARRRAHAGRGQPLARACGLHKRGGLHIIDATAGLGRDACCLARLGARVTLYERHPVLQALLLDACQAQSGDWRLRLDLQLQSSLQADWPRADCLFMDPMFPAAGKRAAPGREMQYLQALLGPDDDAEALLDRALGSGVPRVVLKRPPRGARVRLGRPDLSFGGGRAVYDVYFPNRA